MRARVFTVRLNPETREFDDRALSSFLETHPALSVFGYLVSIDGEPALAVLITHRGSDRPSVVPPRDRPPERPSAGQRSPPLVLADPDRAVDVLRCERCGSKRILIEVVEPDAAREILGCLGLDFRGPRPESARGPPLCD